MVLLTVPVGTKSHDVSLVRLQFRQRHLHVLTCMGQARRDGLAIVRNLKPEIDPDRSQGASPLRAVNPCKRQESATWQPVVACGPLPKLVAGAGLGRRLTHGVTPKRVLGE